MLKKRNWTIPLILSGIMFFIVIGWLLSSEEVQLSEYVKTIVLYWCLGLTFSALLCLYLFKNDTFKLPKKEVYEEVIIFPFSLLASGILIEMGFYPIVMFFVSIISWTIWVLIRKQNRGDELEFTNVLIIIWLVLTVTLSLGQFIGYSKALISKIYGLSAFLDLRISLSIIISTIILVSAIGKIDFSRIETRDLLLIRNDKGNPILIIISLSFVLVNFIIQVLWWLGLFIYWWGVEFVNSMKLKVTEIKESLFDLGMIFLCVIGLYATHVLAEYILLKYLPINNTIKEIANFICLGLIIFLILIVAYLIIRFRYLSWNKWQPVLDHYSFEKEDRIYREALTFPILTSGISGVVLYFLSRIPALKMIYFKNFGVSCKR